MTKLSSSQIEVVVLIIQEKLEKIRTHPEFNTIPCDYESLNIILETLTNE